MEIKNLIERLDDWDGVDAIYNGKFVEVNHHRVFRLLEEAAAALEQLQSENEKLKAQVPKWIPVEERLPEDDAPTGRKIITVMVATKGGKVTIASRVFKAERTRYDGTISPANWSWSRWSNNYVTHWMPLPSPPKEATHD